MTFELPIVLLMALVAIVVAAMVAQRAGEHADRKAGRRAVAGATRRGPLGAVADLLDRSVAAYGLRSRLGVSTRTREQRRADDAQAALVARADEIRHHRIGAPPVRPTHLVVSGRAGGQGRPGVAQDLRDRRAAAGQRTSTLPLELVAAVFAFVVVVGIVVAIWPRGTSGGVLAATATPPPVVATASLVSSAAGPSSAP